MAIRISFRILVIVGGIVGKLLLVMQAFQELMQDKFRYLSIHAHTDQIMKFQTVWA